MHTQNTKTSTK